MTFRELYREIKKRRKLGESYEVIGRALGISKPVVRRIFLGEKPSAHLLNSLNVDPSKKLEATRQRIRKLNEIAQYWGYKSWSDYETQTMRDFEKNFDFQNFQWKELESQNPHRA